MSELNYQKGDLLEFKRKDKYGEVSLKYEISKGQALIN